MAILYYVDQGNSFTQFLTVAPAVILSKSYVNSMLGVEQDSVMGRLNARKPIRDQQRNAWANSVQVPTIPTLHA
ncbi:hypothetical protein J3R82DRAFT_8058 [Butyriboletus roseoflavus]|nr:hypothetical protein J3R82DRAFT_8058 [Butyriboletus roseoflavus]